MSDNSFDRAYQGLNRSANAMESKAGEPVKSDVGKANDDITSKPVDADAAGVGSGSQTTADSNERQASSRFLENDGPTTTLHMTELSNAEFHVFTWLSASKSNHGTKIPIVNGAQLEDDLKEIDYFLRRKISLSERLAYRNCPGTPHSMVFSLLEEEVRAMAASMLKDAKKEERKGKMFERRVDIFNAAEAIFRFFLPLASEDPIALKFWGAIYRLLLVSVSTIVIRCLR
jgi:hypothetical protein